MLVVLLLLLNEFHLPMSHSMACLFLCLHYLSWSAYAELDLSLLALQSARVIHRRLQTQPHHAAEGRGSNFWKMVTVCQQLGSPNLRRSSYSLISNWIGSALFTLGNRWKQKQMGIQLVESCYIGMGPCTSWLYPKNLSIHCFYHNNNLMGEAVMQHIQTGSKRSLMSLFWLSGCGFDIHQTHSNSRVPFHMFLDHFHSQLSAISVWCKLVLPIRSSNHMKKVI